MPTNSESYIIRRFRPEDAPGVTECVREVYGDAYCAHLELYHPDEIVRLNTTGELRSVIALDPGERLVGHYALERSGQSAVAESGEAMVVPAHQHHGLLERMRVLLEDEARNLALLAIFGRCVTSHVFSQKTVERFGELPCGISLGRSPASFHSVTQVLGQRMSTVMYMKYLQGPDRQRLYAPAKYQEIITRIYRQFGVEVEFAEPASPPEGAGQIEMEFRPDLQRATLRVLRVESGSADAITKLCRDLCADHKVEVIYLELPLTQPGAPQLAEALARFYFCGIAPHFLPDGDALRLQYLTVDLDLTVLQLCNTFARELLAFVERDRGQM